MSPDAIESFGWLLTYLVVAAAVLLVVRQIVLWYFRLNHIADDIRYIANYYRRLDAQAEFNRIENARRSGGGIDNLFSSVDDRASG